MEQHYDAIKDMKPTNTIEKTADGFRETWEQAGFKIITKLEGEEISIDMGKGGKDIKVCDVTNKICEGFKKCLMFLSST